MVDTKNMINFDSRDWNSIRDTINKVNEIGCVQLSETDNGEEILFDVYRGDSDHDKLFTTVFQSNGWIRKTYYDPTDHSIEEMFER